MLFNFAIEFSQVASGQNITHPRLIKTSSAGSQLLQPPLELDLK